jgi:hypothetical protein
MTIEFDVLTSIVAAVALVVGLLQYRSTAKKDFIKPIREEQLDLYLQASGAAAGLATLQRGSPKWKRVQDDFLRLYYGPLAMLEDFEHSSETKLGVTVEKAMIAFKSALDGEADTALKNLSLGLAHTCRISLGKSWGYDVRQLRGDYQELIQRYLEMH